MSSSGLASSKTKSANFPFSTVPGDFSKPRNFAGLMVSVCSASSGEKPASRKGRVRHASRIREKRKAHLDECRLKTYSKTVTTGPDKKAARYSACRQSRLGLTIDRSRF